MLELSRENKMFDLADLSKFRLGNHVICDAMADFDRFEGIVVGIELTRVSASNRLEPSITLLNRPCATHGTSEGPK